LMFMTFIGIMARVLRGKFGSYRLKCLMMFLYCCVKLVIYM